LILKAAKLNCALTIAGSDSGGGAGIQADLKAFAAIKVHGASVITCLTAQNPKRVLGVQPATPEFVTRQLEAVFAELPPHAIKTGMLFSTEIIDAIATFLRTRRVSCPLIVDPVMVATSGALLLKKSAVKALCARLLPLADLITPNIPEAEVLADTSISDPEGLRRAARKLHSQFGCALLLKGGHLRGTKEALDIFYDGKAELLLRAPFVRGVATHGTGCTYSAAIAAYCAQGKPLIEAVGLAKRYITRAIANSVRVQSHCVLGW
jgi:hydroxymethylpyrimidine/phosphomethylpyrimidine kinase